MKQCCKEKITNIIVGRLNESGVLPYEVVWKPTLITNELIRKTLNEANMDENCAGVITWMHTFSPAKSWILGLQEYRKPLLHLHTQFNQEIPYDTIDMDFMNENQSAHGGREFGHIFTRMGIERKVVAGHWSDSRVQEKIASWMRTAVGVVESSHVRVMRVADNMRNVAVTEGDKVEAQIEIGFERFLEEKDYQAIVTHFGDLGSLKQLPGLAIQRLMEDYTYNLVPGKEGILQAHMLEVCPSIADGPISIKEQPLSMGDREDPARLVFTAKEGPAVATSLIDLGDRFRLIINSVNCKKTEKPMPKLPVATAFWTPEPDLATGAEAWILCGGAHHTAFSYDLTAEQMGDWADMMGIEAVFIDKDTTIRGLKNELRWNELSYRR